MWGELFGKKDKDFEEFLANPRDLYARIKDEVQELQAKNKQLKDSLDAKKQELKESEDNFKNQIDELYEERDDLIVKNAEQMQSLAVSEGAKLRYLRKYEIDINSKLDQINLDNQKYKDELRDKFNAEYKTSFAKKSADLEKQYYHEVHTFIETQNDKFLETIPNVVRETIIGFHNEKVNQE